MPNGDDEFFFIRDTRVTIPRVPRGRTRPTDPDTGRPIRVGFPVPVIPTFPDLPTQPTRPTPTTVRFPPSPAANDPVFSRAGSILRAGNVVVGIAIILDQLIRKAQDLRIEEEQREREAVFRLETRRRALEREPVEIVVTEPRPPTPPQPVFDPSVIPDLPELPTQRPSPAPEQLPEIDVPVEVPLPGEIEAPRPASPSLPSPATVPQIGRASCRERV